MRSRFSRSAPLLLTLLLCLSEASASASEARLLSDLFAGYDRRVRPVLNHSDAVIVDFRVTVQTLDLHPERNQATAMIWATLTWTDARLVWDRDDYDGIGNIRLSPGQLWMPDVMPYNMLPRTDSSWMGETPVVVKSNGNILYVGPASVRVSCRRDFSHGGDIFRCSIKFGSWTYNGFQLDLTMSEDTADLSSFVSDDAFWTLQNASMRRNTITYACCPEPYVDVTLELYVRRSASLSAWPNLPVSVSLLTALATFLVPVDSPQKLTLPCLSLMAAGSAVITEFGLVGNAEYRAHFLRVYHVYTYLALAVLLWSVLIVMVGRPRACRLPSCLRRLLTSCLACLCCLASPPDPDRKELCHEWTALAELLDRLAFIVFMILIFAGSIASTTTYQ